LVGRVFLDKASHKGNLALAALLCGSKTARV